MNMLQRAGKIIIISGFLTCLWAEGPWNNPGVALPAGITHKTFYSTIAGTDVGYAIYLPSDYETAVTTYYPVVYMLGGLSTTENSTAASMGSILDGYIRNGRSCKIIMVFINPRGDSWYCGQRRAGDDTRIDSPYRCHIPHPGVQERKGH